MRDHRITGLHIALGAMLCLSVLPNSFAQTQYNGNWSGRTGQNQPISFTVTNGQITSLSVQFSVSVTGCISTTSASSTSLSLPITNGSFSFSGSMSTSFFGITGGGLTIGGGSGSVTFTGSFTSTTIAGGTVALGRDFVCRQAVSTNWNATWQPPPPTIPTGNNQTFIPHSAFGSGFRTRLLITNRGTSSNALSINRIAQSGQVVERISRTLSGSGTLQIVDSESSRTQNATAQWFAIASQSPIAASVLFDCCAAGSLVTSAVGVLVNLAPGTSFAAPFIFQRQGVSNQPVLVEGLAVANPAESANTVTIRVLDPAGNQVSTDTLTSIPAFGQTALTVSDLPTLSAQLAGTNSFLGSLLIGSTQPMVPVIVGNLGGRLFSLPLVSTSSGSAAQPPESAQVGAESTVTDAEFSATANAASSAPQTLQLNQAQALPSLATLNVIPHFVVGGSFVTRVYVRNLASGNNNMVLQFMTQNGAVASTLPQMTLAPGEIFQLSSGEENRSTPQTTQWVALGSDGPVSPAVLFDCCATGSDVTSAVGVLAQAPGTSFIAPFVFQRDAVPNQPVLVQGLGIANRSESTNTVTVGLLSETGSQVASDTLAPIPGLGQTAFTVSELPNVRAFLQGKNTYLGSLTITGTQTFAPVIVGNLGGRLFSLPLAAR